MRINHPLQVDAWDPLGLQEHEDPQHPLLGDGLDYQLHIRFGAEAIAILPVAVALEIAILVDAAAPDIVAVENDFADHRQLHLPS